MVTLRKFMGWIGATAFAISAAPQTLLIIKQGHAYGTSGLFLALWLIGELCMLWYILPTRQWPLIFNYTVNLAFLLIILYYYVVGGGGAA